jgi:hypothetical protein
MKEVVPNLEIKRNTSAYGCVKRARRVVFQRLLRVDAFVVTDYVNTPVGVVPNIHVAIKSVDVENSSIFRQKGVGCSAVDASAKLVGSILEFVRIFDFLFHLLFFIFQPFQLFPWLNNNSGTCSSEALQINQTTSKWSRMQWL